MLSLKIPTHLKCVATLPCEISSVLKSTIDENMFIVVHKNNLQTTTLYSNIIFLDENYFITVKIFFNFFYQGR